MLTAFVITGTVLVLVFYIIALVLAYRVGWEHAHHTVAKECETQGKFFVKNKIYHIEKIEEFIVKLWIIQMSKHRIAKTKGIPIKDITVKSGDKLFAPRWDFLMDYKKDGDTLKYTEKFIPLMRESYKSDKQSWLDLCNQEEVAIACYCKAGDFCHRYLLVDILEKVCNSNSIVFEYMGELG